MDKDSYIQLLEKNASNIEMFKNFDTTLFHEMLERIEEAKNCIIFEMPIASISLTNHILERVLKLALIYDFTGFSIIDTENYGNHYTEAHVKYNHLSLFETTNECRNSGLITSEQSQYIQENIREQFRNGFSHSDNQTILLSYPNFTQGCAGHIKQRENKKFIDINIKTIPGLSSAIVYDFARANYVNYFTIVFKLMKHIEIVLKRKHNITQW